MKDRGNAQEQNSAPRMAGAMGQCHQVSAGKSWPQEPDWRAGNPVGKCKGKQGKTHSCGAGTGQRQDFRTRSAVGREMPMATRVLEHFVACHLPQNLSIYIYIYKNVNALQASHAFGTCTVAPVAPSGDLAAAKLTKTGNRQVWPSTTSSAGEKVLRFFVQQWLFPPVPCVSANAAIH